MNTFIEYKHGDLFDTDCQHIAHGVNTQSAMLSGVAFVIAEKYPEVESVYNAACESGELQPGGFQLVTASDGKVIVNLATQELPCANAKYDYVYESFNGVLAYLSQRGVRRLAMPKIGAGIGGLDWEQVALIIQPLAEQYQIVLEVWVLVRG